MTTQVRHRELRPHAYGMVTLLIIQYILGTITNLFVAFPHKNMGDKVWIFASQQLPLLLHMVVGLLLFIGTTALLFRAIVTSSTTWIIASTISFISILVAVLAGVTFVPTQTDTYSLVMAIAFIIALLSLVWGIYMDKPQSMQAQT